MKEVSTEVVIEASAERVWEILTDFAKFPEWNPFIRQMSGEVRTGAQLQVQLGPTGGRVMSFKPKMVNVETNREMSWLGRLLIPGLFNGEHSFTIEALDEKGVRFVQHEKFTGLLVPFMAKSLDRDTRRVLIRFRRKKSSLDLSCRLISMYRIVFSIRGTTMFSRLFTRLFVAEIASANLRIAASAADSSTTFLTASVISATASSSFALLPIIE